MPDFGRWTANGGDPSLNEINRTDRFLDALATEQPVYSTDAGEAELAHLLAEWRDEMRQPPAAALVTQRDAVKALGRAVASQQRTRMSMAVIGSVAAALLCLGGFGAVVYGAGPGDALYGLRTTLFGQQEATRDDQVVLAAQTELNQVQQLIDQGQWTAAHDKLQALSTTVQTVNDTERKQELEQEWNRLSVKVEARDPNAEPPPVPAAPPGTGDSATTSSETSSTSPSSSSETTTSPSDTTTSSPSSQTTTSSSPSETATSTTTSATPTSTTMTTTTVPTSTTTTTTVTPTTTTTTTTAPSTTTTTTTTATTTTTTTTTTTVAAPALQEPTQRTGSTVGETGAAGTSTGSASTGSAGTQHQQSGSASLTAPVTTTTIIQLPILGGVGGAG